MKYFRLLKDLPWFKKGYIFKLDYENKVFHSGKYSLNLCIKDVEKWGEWFEEVWQCDRCKEWCNNKSYCECCEYDRGDLYENKTVKIEKWLCKNTKNNKMFVCEIPENEYFYYSDCSAALRIKKLSEYEIEL